MSAQRNVGRVRAVPAAPADVKADAVRRQPAQRMIERLHAHLLEFLEFLERRLRIDHVPVVRQARIVDLQHDAGIDDRLVFVAHRIGRGEQKLLLGLVVKVDAAGEAARADRAHEAFFGAGRGQRLFQIVDVGRERRMAGIFDRPGAGRPAHRPARRAAHQAAARFRILIELAEFLPVTAVGERCERDVRNARFLVLGFVRGRCGAARRRKARHAREGVIPPRAVIVRTGHRFAELAVVGNVDAECTLLRHHIRDRCGQHLRIGAVIRLGFADGDRFAQRDQIGRPRQAAGMRGQNAIGALVSLLASLARPRSRQAEMLCARRRMLF